MSKSISGSEQPLSKVFSADYDFSIPSYQRPYAWTTVQAGELFADLHDFFTQESVDQSYFLGSIVLIKKEGEPAADVIDGQQRLTTLTIILAALAQRMDADGRDGIRQYLREKGNEFEGLEPKPRLGLRRRDQDFFHTYIQGVRLDELAALDEAQLANDAQRNIRANALLLLGRIDAAFETEEARRAFATFLVKRCVLVVVSTASQDSAFRVFSVLNSRGLDLLPTDLLKADIIGRIESDDHKEHATEIWEQLEESVGRDGFNDVFGHIRMIYVREKARRSLLDEFKERVMPGLGPVETLVEQTVAPYTGAFRKARWCGYEATAHADEVNEVLGWLNRLDNADWMPVAMQFLVQKGNEPEYVARFMRKLERLAASMFIRAQDVNARITRYARVLAAMDQPHSSVSPLAEVELTHEERAHTREALDGKVYLFTPRRRNYILHRLDSFVSDASAKYDSRYFTVEHVLPQTVDPASEWACWWPDEEERTQWVHRLANLVPLNRYANSAAQNYEFARKKAEYFTEDSGVSSYALTTQVLATDTWMPATLSRRQEDLLSVLARCWEL